MAGSQVSSQILSLYCAQVILNTAYTKKYGTVLYNGFLGHSFYNLFLHLVPYSSQSELKTCDSAFCAHMCLPTEIRPLHREQLA